MDADWADLFVTRPLPDSLSWLSGTKLDMVVSADSALVCAEGSTQTLPAEAGSNGIISAKKEMEIDLDGTEAA